MALMTREEAQKLIEKVLSFSKAKECNVTVGASELAQTRVANNSILTSGRVSGAAVAISSTIGTQTGRVVINETADDDLRAAVARSEELARFSPPDPEYQEPVGKQDYPEIEAWDAPTAKAGHAELLEVVRTAVESAAAKKLEGAGYVEREAQALAIGNSRGNFGYHTRTDAEYSLTVRTPDGTGSGWAMRRSYRFRDLDGAEVARVAIDKAVLSQKPRPLAPGRYTVILEPAAASGLLNPLFGGPFNARAAEEGRSLLTKRGGGTHLGDKLFADIVTVSTDPFDPRMPGTPWQGGVPTRRPSAGGFFFGGGGGGGASYLPAQRMTWIEKGVVKNMSYDRYWAEKKKTKPTPSAGASTVMQGQEHSLEDLIKSTERGLLVTNFWYIRSVNPQTVQLTGLTRDGLFMIENGKIAYPVQNFRWNESPAVALKNVEMLSRPVRVSSMILPALKVRDFNFTSVSDAV